MRHREVVKRLAFGIAIVSHVHQIFDIPDEGTMHEAVVHYFRHRIKINQISHIWQNKDCPLEQFSELGINEARILIKSRSVPKYVRQQILKTLDLQ